MRTNEVVEQAKRILGYRTGECPPEIERWIIARLREMSFWDMVKESKKFRIRM